MNMFVNQSIAYSHTQPVSHSVTDVFLLFSYISKKSSLLLRFQFVIYSVGLSQVWPFWYLHKKIRKISNIFLDFLNIIYWYSFYLICRLRILKNNFVTYCRLSFFFLSFSLCICLCCLSVSFLMCLLLRSYRQFELVKVILSWQYL